MSNISEILKLLQKIEIEITEKECELQQMSKILDNVNYYWTIDEPTCLMSKIFKKCYP